MVKSAIRGSSCNTLKGLHRVFRNSIFPLSQIFVLMQRKGLVISKSQRSLKKLNLYWILSLGLLTEIAVFLAVMPSKKSVSICKSVDVKEDCSNVLHPIELMLIVPFTNTKMKKLFSTMNSRGQINEKYSHCKNFVSEASFATPLQVRNFFKCSIVICINCIGKMLI